MTSNQMVVIAAAAMAVTLLVILRRPLMMTLLRGTVRWGLQDAGSRALAKQPATIHLLRRDVYAWKDPARMEGFRQGLLALGFTKAGIYAVDAMPGTMMEFLLDDKDGLYAVIYEHPIAGVWLNLIALYQDGTSITYTTAADRGLEQRPGHPVVHQPGASAEVIYQWAMAERPKGSLKQLSAAGIVTEFERAYSEGLAWRKQKGISAQEVVKVIKTRSAADVRVVPSVEFLGEKDGAPERELKTSLSKLLEGWNAVDRAYLATVRNPKSQQDGVALCLVSKAGADQALIGAVRGIFGAQFRDGTALDIVFLQGIQEFGLAKVCRPFFQRTSAV